ncbi:hypothetical protein VNO78_25820 [Psophocarpus tetragonolobus]|uniref:Uncharacterized protein n=1 Tax=Psophocarpus tetragonolobus TaxID=3891 RepID=A0AAN9S765_PSOTE
MHKRLKNRRYSSANSSGCLKPLEPVAEYVTFKLSRLYEHGLAADQALASRDALKVEQKVFYGELLFSRGLKM